MLLVTQNNVFDNINFDVGRVQLGAYDAHRRVTTGNRVNVASDDPIAAVRGTLSNSNLARLRAMDRVARVAQSQLATAEAIVGECVGQLQKIAELAIAASSGNLNAENRLAIAQEVQVIHDFLVNAANSQQAGTYLFAGLGNTAPFADDGTYAGNGGIRSVPVAFGLNVTVNLPGDQIFNVTSGQNVLGDVQDFVTALQANDVLGCQKAVDTSQRGIDQLTGARSTLSASTIKMQEAEVKRGDTMLLLRKEHADTMEADQAESLVSMSRMNNALDTTLAGAARVIEQLRANPLLR